MLSRRHLLTGSLAAAGLTAMPWKARGATGVYQRAKGMVTTYQALSPTPMVTATRSVPGYSPTLASVYQYLLQPGAAPPGAQDPYQAALTLVQRPWFNGLGSPNPLGQPPKKQLVRHTQFTWIDTHPTTGFHPVFPIKRIMLQKEAAVERMRFKERARIQTQLICAALLHRWANQDELAQGMHSIIRKTHTIQSVTLPNIRPWIAEEVGDTNPPAAPTFGSTLAPGDYFPNLVAPVDPIITHAALEALAASAAFAEAAAIMGVGAGALYAAANEAIGISTFGALSAFGLSVILTIATIGLAVTGIVVFFAIVSGKPRPDGTLDIFSEIAPFGSSATGCGGCNSGVTPAIAPVIDAYDVNMSIGLSPAGSVPADDAGAAPGVGVAGDTGEGGDF